MRTSVLLCPPTYFDVKEIKNPHMRYPIDHVLAQHQWQNLRRAFERCGLTVETIDPVPQLEDMVFSANQVFVGHSAKHGKFIIPSRMRYASRQKEVPHYVEWFRSHGYKVIELNLENEFLEGHGDLLWDSERSKIWAGYGFRSSLGGVQKFADAMDEMGIPVSILQLVDEHCYHLDTCLALLKPGAALIFPEAFSKESLHKIRAAIPRIYEVTREDVLRFVCNGVLAGNNYVLPHLTPAISAALEKEGLQPLVVDTSEFEKSGGGVFCMTCFLD
jgi:arginine dihydrolase